MRAQPYSLIVATTLLCSGPMAYAQDESDGDDSDFEVTMTLLPEGATQPDALTRIIELPPRVVEEGRDNAQQGLDNANDARERREKGLNRAAEAAENGRALGEAMREQAQENRENAGRGERPDPPRRPELPNGPPGPSNRPATPND